MSQQIKCPACGRKFQFPSDLTGKTVECGACDHRFTVEEQDLVKERKKFYPGEHGGAGLDRFGRSQVREELPVTFQTASYNAQTSPLTVTPTTPGQAFAVVTGLSVMGFFALIFMLSSGEGQAFTDVDLFQRLVLGVFVCLVGSTLLIFGGKNWRGRALVCSVLLSAGILAMIFLRPVYKTPISASAEEGGGPKDPATVSDTKGLGKESDEERYLARIGYPKVVEFIQRNDDKERGIDGHQRVIGIYAHPISDNSFNAIESYLKRRLGLGATVPIYRYKRNENNQDSLIVLSGKQWNFAVVAEALESLGEVATLPSRRIIDLKVSQTLFAAPSPQEVLQLNDETNELFCVSNLNELDLPDLDRVKMAVQRLGGISDEAQMRYKPKIASKLFELITSESDDDLLEACGNALKKWGTDDPALLKNLSTLVVAQLERREEVQRSVVEFLIANKSKRSLMIVDRMWSLDPNRWGEQYASQGSAGEDRLLYHFQNSPVELKNNALIILKRIGTKKSLPILRAALNGKNDGFDISVQRAIDSISVR